MSLSVNIKNILKTFKTEINLFIPVYEAIANSLEANSKNILIEFIPEENLLDCNYIKSIVVKDDGDGFNDENLNSFNEYLSDFKAKLGCKGVGRFTWLKIFDSIAINSFTNGKHIFINFNKNYDDKKDVIIKEYNNLNNKNCTEIIFSNVISQKYKQLEININDFKRKLLKHFLIRFYELKQKNIDFCISIKLNDEMVTIQNADIEEFSTESFQVHDDLNNVSYSFDIKYNFFEKDDAENECLLYGNGRVIEHFDMKNIFLALPGETKITILVYSKYFDERINDERTAFTFSKSENNPTIPNPIPFNKISKVLIDKIEQILVEKFPSLEELNDLIVEQCIDEKPYLAKYIKQNKSIIKNKKDLLKKSEQLFEKEKEEVKIGFLNLLKEKNVNEDLLLEQFNSLNDLSNRELAQYFLYRQTIIDGLKKLNDDNEKIEKYLHSLFLKLGCYSKNTDELKTKYNNCIWLLDDKFMSYTNMYSDIKIKKIMKDIMSDNDGIEDNVEPDLTIFYSNKDVIVVEFKAIGTSANNKLNAIPEINRNLKIVAENFDEINCIYGYIITKFDEKFKHHISSQNGIRTLYSNGSDPIYYYYNENVKDINGVSKPSHVYILSTETLYIDADARNKMFIDIIKNN